MNQSHLNALQSKHSDLDARIMREEQRPVPDAATVATLKKMKLRVKEELASIQ